MASKPGVPMTTAAAFDLSAGWEGALLVLADIPACAGNSELAERVARAVYRAAGIPYQEQRA
jgi:hypothetical protein